MKLNKNGFIMTVVAILGLYVMANAMLWFKKGGFHYFETDIYFTMTSIFLFMFLLILPRTVEIMLGSERKPPEKEINAQETLDSEDASQYRQPQ